MTTGFFMWSQTASANATADSSVNYAEGQAPSSLNDSARAAMASLAKYRDDISGAIVTAGTSTAYTVSSYSGFDTLAHMSGQMIAFTPHATNGATVTLNVDGLGAKPLRSSPSVELPSGSLLLGTPYVATYNNSDAVWYLQGGLSNPYNVPVGGMIDWTGSTAPNSAFAMPYGQSLSRTTYASLWTFAQTEIAAGNTLYTNGDGTTTFGILDLRGRVSACPDNMGGVTANRLTAAMSSNTIGASGGVANYTLTQGNLPAVSYNLTGTNATISVNSTNPNVITCADGGAAVANGSGRGGFAGINIFNSSIASTGSYTPAGTIGPLGSAGAFNLIQPTLIVPKILRII
jgi:microcystin-dependent protein